MAEPIIPTEHSPAPGMEALAWERRPGAFRPDPGRSLAGIMPTLLKILNDPPRGFPDLQAYLPPGAPRRAGRVLLLCLDALGFKELAQAGGLRDLYRDFGTWVTSVFPTITSCALSSMYQALPPARHGITGHVIWKDFPGALVDMLRMQVPGATVPLVAAGFDVNRWKREPGLLERSLGDGIKSYHLMDRHIVGSGLSTLIYGRTPLVPFFNPLEGLAKAGRMLSDMEKGWVGLYLDDVDTLTHVMTGDAPQTGLLLDHLEQALAQMAADLSPRVVDDTVVMVVADHGQSTIANRLPLYGDNLKWLEAHTRAVGHSGRVLHVYLDDGQEAKVLPWLKEFVGNHGQVFAFEEVMHLTGPPLNGSGIGDLADGHADWVRRSLGDLVVILDDGWNWQRRAERPDAGRYDSQLVSQHGALSWNEMFVPFICAPMAAVLNWGTE